VRVVVLPDNAGPGKARNAGLAAALSDLVFFIDNDVVIDKDCTRLLEEALDADPAAAIAAPRVVYADRPQIIQYDGADSHFLGLMILENGDVPMAEADDKVRRTGSVITCAFMVSRRRLPDPAPFDESFFIYLEDHDFGLRMRALGAEIISVPKAICLHGEGTAGLSIRALGTYLSMRVFCLIRNRWQLILKTYQLRTILVLAPLFMVYELAQLVIVVKKGWLREWSRSVSWIFGHWAALMAKRRLVQENRTRGDRELLRGGAIPLRADLAEGSVERVLRRMLEGVAALYWRGAVRLL
jgi:GT2 family glycosyltransferase